MQRHQPFGHGRAELAGHRQRQRVDHDHLAVEFRGRRGDFGAEEATTDHNHPARLEQVRAQGQCVICGAQDVHAVQIVPEAQPARRDAGRDDDTVIVHCGSIGELDSLVCTVQLGRASVPTCHVQVVEPLGVAQQHPAGVCLVHQYLLGQRRSVIGQPRLVTDQRE